MKINSIDKDIKTLFSSSYYKIPRFQRPYSWDRENISEFWNDVIVDSEGEYFIGSMVVFKMSSDTYGIVDGQQRLTTITMILCALRGALEAEGFSNLAQGIHNIIERKNINNQSQYILSTETSYPYFQECIQKFGKSSIKIEPGEEEKNLENIYNLIILYVKDAVEAIKRDSTINAKKKNEKLRKKLIEIRDKILNLKLISIDLDNEDDAYIIFETLNTRGKDLSVSDLVKNLITKYIKPKATDTPKIQWERLLSIVEGSSADLSVDTFLHHYWLSKYDFVTLKKLFKRIKKQVSKQNTQDFLNKLEIDAVTYREIHETNYRKWRIEEQAIKRSLEALSIFRVKQQVPMVLSLIRNYKEGALKIKPTEEILSAIEKFHFLFTAITSQRSSGGISLMYASSAKKLSKAKTHNEKNEIIKELKKKIREKIPNYKEFEANFGEIIVTNEFTKHKKLIQYILSKIDGFSQKTYPVDYSNMTIEHLAPQNSKMKQSVIGQLGNLIFISKDLNEKLKDKPFMKKKEILVKSGYNLDPVLSKVQKWEKEDIQKRTEYLAGLAYRKIWLI